MNVIEKIIAAKSGKPNVVPGQLIDVAPDWIMVNDACGPLAMDVFNNELMAKDIATPEKAVIVMDHYTPSSSIDAANAHNKMRKWAIEHNVTNVYDGVGVCHQLMLEKHVSPGQLIIGADSHTCTYGAIGALSTGMGSTDVATAWKQGKIWLKAPQSIKIIVTGEWPDQVYAKDLIMRIIGDISANGATYKAIVFEGLAIESLSIAERATICNMAIEAGAKFAYVQPDEETRRYMNSVGRPEYTTYADDPDSTYEKTLHYNVAELSPQIAYPHSVDCVKPVREFEGLELNELFLGACTNGRYEDLEIAAEILKGKKIAKKVRLIVTPASNDIFIKAIEAGIIATLIKSGAMITTPGCSACFGGSGGILGKGERLLTSANRNFKGRVGSADSEIYIASPAVIACSAIRGKITDPRRMKS